MSSSSTVLQNKVLAPKMKVLAVTQPGPESQLRMEEAPLPSLLNGQLLIEVQVAGVNRADLMQRRGLYPPQPGESPILGLEVSGVVVAVQNSELEHWLGKSVMALVPGGGYAQYVKVLASHCMLVPDGWSWQQAAAMPEVFLTAYQLLFSLGHLQAGQRVLLHAGASGVGTAAIQLALARGAEVAVTVGSDEKAEFCRSLGVSCAINYRSEDFVQRIQQHWSDGAQLILDPVAGDYIAKNARILAMDAKVVVYALMAGRHAELDLAPWFRKRAQLICTTLRNRSDQYKSKLVASLWQDFSADFSQGRIQPVLHQVVPWTDAEQAHRWLTENKTMGKVVLQIKDSASTPPLV